MQDCLALSREIAHLSAKVGDLTVIRSSELWNPVAAVIVDNLELPVNIIPRKSAIRIPIPDLYGFAASAYCFIVPGPLHHTVKNKVYPIPGSHLLDDICISRHKEQFVDFRERRGWPDKPTTFFLNLSWHKEGFIHSDLDVKGGGKLDQQGGVKPDQRKC